MEHRPHRGGHASHAHNAQFDEAFAAMPLLAILRGIEPSQAVEAGEALVSAGFRIIEVPLNSPEPFESIRLLQAAVGDRAVIGAGTVVAVEDVRKVAQAGGKLIVSPNTDAAVIRASVELGLVSAPGFSTPTEAFAALAAGAHVLKLFPAVPGSEATLKACLAVLPEGTRVVAVGGVSDRASMEVFQKAGAVGFGLGSACFKAGISTEEIATRAAKLVGAVEAMREVGTAI